MQITQNLQPTLQMAFTAAYNRYLEQYLKRTPEVYGEETINTLESEQYWLGDIPGMRAWVTARTYQQIREYDRKLTSKPWTSEGFRYNRVQNTGPNVGQLTSRMSRQLNIADQFADEVCVRFLQNGQGTNNNGTPSSFNINGYDFTNEAFDKRAFFWGGSNAADTAAKADRGYSNVIDGAGTTLGNIGDDIVKALTRMAGGDDDSFVSDTGLKLAIRPTRIITSYGMYLKINQVLGSNTDTSATNNPNGNPNINNPLSGANLTVGWSSYITGNSYYILSTDMMMPVYWQTTTVEGRRIIMDVDDTNLASEGWYGIATSLWGMAGYGFPWCAVKIEN